MSGGRWDYRQYMLNEVADDLEHIVNRNGDNDEEDYNDWNFPVDVIQVLKDTVEKCRELERVLHHVDYLLSGDHDVHSFMRVIKKENR